MVIQERNTSYIKRYSLFDKILISELSTDEVFDRNLVY